MSWPVLVLWIFVAIVSIDICSFINDNNRMYEIRHYLTEDDKDVYLEWLKIQRDTVAKIAIVKRINRVEQGNFGDHEFCRDGIWELRIDVGAGYRVYYAVSGKDIVLLLCGGNKRSQSADINRACEYWNNWKKENGK